MPILHSKFTISNVKLNNRSISTPCCLNHWTGNQKITGQSTGMFQMYTANLRMDKKYWYAKQKHPRCKKVKQSQKHQLVHIHACV